MPNPFAYFKKPETVQQAQSNLNHWWYEGMEMPADTPKHMQAQWPVYITEMKRSAQSDMNKIKAALVAA